MPEDRERDQTDDTDQDDQSQNKPEPFAQKIGRVAGHQMYKGDFAGAEETRNTYLKPSDLLEPGYDDLIKDLPEGLKAEIQEIHDAELQLDEAHAMNAEKDADLRLRAEVEAELKKKQAESAEAAKRDRIREEIKRLQKVDAIAAAGPSPDQAALEAVERAVAIIDDPATDWAEKDRVAGEALDLLGAVEVGTARPVTFDTAQFLEDVDAELAERREK
jgi:hypothetical protein